jgi:hypothetical protein
MFSLVMVIHVVSLKKKLGIQIFNNKFGGWEGGRKKREYACKLIGGEKIFGCAMLVTRKKN